MQFSDQIIKVMDEIGKRFGMAVDWTSKNVVPYIADLCNRIVRFEIYTSIMWMVFSLLGIVSSILLIKFDKKDGYSRSDGIAPIFYIIAIIICLEAIGVQIYDILTAITIPEKIWLDYIKEYTK